MTNIKLIKPWAGHKPGAVLEVLAPGEDPRQGAVDPTRAAAMLAQKFAVNASEKTAPAATKEA